MNRLVQKLSDEELKGYPIRDYVNGWFFRVIEVSQGFYCVEGIDYWGKKISRMGVNPEQLLGDCKKEIDDFN